MGLSLFCAVALGVIISPALVAGVQTSFHQPTAQYVWDAPPHPDETGHLIFDAVVGLLKHAPNTDHKNGHGLIPATVASGTPLFHGRGLSTAPPAAEWLSFDADHSLLFATLDTTPYLFIYAAARPLRLLYFDGYSAPGLPGGTADTQEVIVRGNVTDDRGWRNPLKRLTQLCEWGKKYDIDGFLRMEMDFEIMYCNFSDGGLALTAAVPVLPVGRLGPMLMSDDNEGLSLDPGNRPFVVLDALPPKYPPGPPPEGASDLQGLRGPAAPVGGPGVPPSGWKGSLRDPNLIRVEAWAAGIRHNFRTLPGVNLDYSRYTTLYDTKYASLVEMRRHETRRRYRLLNIAQEDARAFLAELDEVWTRPSSQTGSGIHWGDLMRYVQELYADRLDFLRYLLGGSVLHPSNTATNIAQTVSDVRQQVLTMLAPYITQDAVPFPENQTLADSSWLDPTMRRCASLWTSMLNVSSFTPQEHVLKSSLDATTRQICRTLGRIWISAFEAESIVGPLEQTSLLLSWLQEIERLMEWLGWTTWVKCEPACSEDEMCTLPQMGAGRGPDDATPYCMSRIRGSSGFPGRSPGWPGRPGVQGREVPEVWMVVAVFLLSCLVISVVIQSVARPWILNLGNRYKFAV